MSIRFAAGMNMAVDWRHVVVEAMKGAVILALLERLYVTKAASWFEDHVGACACRVWSARSLITQARRLTERRAQTTTAFRASCSATPP